MAVDLALAERSVPRACAELAAWLPVAAQPRDRLERALYVAIVAQVAGDRRSAVQRAQEVLAEAELEGHMRLVLDAGDPAALLLHAVLSSVVMPTVYVRQLAWASTPQLGAIDSGQLSAGDRGGAVPADAAGER